MKKLTSFDLQLFAENDEEIEIIDAGFQGEEDDEEVIEDEELDENTKKDDEEVDDETDEENDDDDDSDDDSGLDKKTKAIIRHKKEAKEAKERISELEQQINHKKQEKEKDELIDKKIEAGYSETEAKRMATLEIENRELKQEVINNRFSKLESKYPLISNHKTDILDMQKNLPGATLEEVYLAKFYKGTAEEAEKIAKQRMLYAKEEASSKSQEKGSSESMSHNKANLSPSDERAYKVFKESHPNTNRKDFKELLDTDELEE